MMDLLSDYDTYTRINKNPKKLTDDQDLLTRWLKNRHIYNKITSKFIVAMAYCLEPTD